LAGAGTGVIPFNIAQQVHEQVNNSTEYVTDQAQHGKPDFWADCGDLGDCEDYALAKRRILRDAGYGDLCHMALCWTETGEYHAVLIVECLEGNFVLDNRHAFPMKKQDLGYRWDKWECGGQWLALS
jgi:predicted transglutaminase-like cysteine proteinase